MQVQGSGRVHLAEGGTLNLGFDGSNNRPYTAIGNVLVEMGVMQKDDVTWPAIRDWLKRNPQQARDVMRKNERYIFFKDTRTTAATGAAGRDPAVAPSAALPSTRLHARSARRYGSIPHDPSRPSPGSTEIYRRLMIAQDELGRRQKDPLFTR